MRTPATNTTGTPRGLLVTLPNAWWSEIRRTFSSGRTSSTTCSSEGREAVVTRDDILGGETVFAFPRKRFVRESEATARILAAHMTNDPRTLSPTSAVHAIAHVGAIAWHLETFSSRYNDRPHHIDVLRDQATRERHEGPHVTDGSRETEDDDVARGDAQTPTATNGLPAMCAPKPSTTAWTSAQLGSARIVVSQRSMFGYFL